MSNLDRAIAKAGGVAKLAAQLLVVQGAVSNWKKRGGEVPVVHCATIELITAGEVRRWDLRPDDWHRIWPELIGTEGAPAVPALATTECAP